MSSILKITRLNYSELFNWQVVSCIGILALHLLISFAVIRLADTPGPAGVGDFIGMVFMVVMGILFFAPGFKYVLSQGVSRKVFFWAGNLSLFSLSAVLAVAVTVVYLISLKIANLWMLYELIYGERQLAVMVIWELVFGLFLGEVSWLIRMVYYVANRPVKYIFSITPFVLAALLIFFNALADGRIGRAIWIFLKNVMGVSTEPNPVIGILSLLAASVICGALIFLLIRRAQVND